MFKMKPYIKISLFVVLVIAVAGILTGLYLFNMKHADLAKTRPDFIVTATSLQKDFEDNEKTASARYINKILEVSGTIVAVIPADSSDTNISLKTGSDMSSVICTFHKMSDPSKLKSGDEITLRGQCSGFLMDVLLNNCALIAGRK
jgi:hypothetical protein